MAFRPHDKRHREMQEDVKPPNSRLFILCGKGIREDTFRDAFGKFGTVEDIWIVKDRRTMEEKGVVYIKFSKASEAALAMEEMNMKTLPGHPKPLKVLIASSKREGAVRDPREDEKNLRLFVICPKSYSKEDLKKEFEKFGDIDSVMVVSDKHSGERKGFGYVRFHRPYHAALAFENCDPSFKPKFADPKNSERGRERDRDFDLGSGGGYGGGGYDRETNRFGGGYNDFNDYDSRDRGSKRQYESIRGPPRDIYDAYMHEGANSGPPVAPAVPVNLRGLSPGSLIRDLVSPAVPVNRGGQTPMDILQSYNTSTMSTRLQITAPIGLTQGYLTRLFSLIPGLEYCDLNETTGVAYARYISPQCANYARDKLNGFEYPIGSRLLVRFADEQRPMEGPPMGTPNMMDTSYGGYPGPRGGGGGGGGPPPDNQNETLRRAAAVLEKAGLNPDTILNTSYNFERVPYCSIPLPPPKQMMPEDTEVAQRLFIVCQPSGIPEKVLRDAFCRMGNLIDVYLLPARNYGYAKFATKECAMKAIQTLHGQNLAGNRLKVLEAEPPRGPEEEEPSKKPRM
ncbi:RNA-binding protein 45-like [Crassostrea angulata]|uniref:RNA-binding protein 45-like n=1 Tax=Magallana angulata TaxID=2784310 RepID=UPI0022B213A3|nr:RNA-binding protein 45-like [Crassostrea angulata]XP_052683191.1 RNA-binding protein 45-like [Crassostrea angulata]